MILSTLRKYEMKSPSGVVTCEDRDFVTAETLAEIYLRHAVSIYESLPRAEVYVSNVSARRLLDSLPAGTEFTKSDAEKAGKALGFSDRAVRNYLSHLCGRGPWRSEATAATLKKRNHALCALLASLCDAKGTKGMKGILHSLSGHGSNYYPCRKSGNSAEIIILSK